MSTRSLNPVPVRWGTEALKNRLWGSRGTCSAPRLPHKGLRSVSPPQNRHPACPGLPWERL
jgi:hypothetical protein